MESSAKGKCEFYKIDFLLEVPNYQVHLQWSWLMLSFVYEIHKDQKTPVISSNVTKKKFETKFKEQEQSKWAKQNFSTKLTQEKSYFPIKKSIFRKRIIHFQ